MKILQILIFILSINVFANELLTTDKSLISGKLENGFSYIIKKNQKPKDSASLRLVVKIGSLEENDNQKGVAHLVEHLAFNGTKHFPNNELIAFFESMGVAFGSHLNASTSTDNTTYKLEIPLKNDNLQKAMQVMNDWAGGIKFTKKELEKEKGVVVEEARARYDLRYRLFLQQKDILYANSKFQHRMPIGDMNIIKNISLDEVKNFYDTWYRPEFMHLVVVGDFDESKVENLIKTTFKNLKNKSDKKRASRKIPLDNSTKVAFFKDKELTISSVGIFIAKEANKLNSAKNLKQSLIEDIMIALFNQKANEQIIKKNPISKKIKLSSFKIGDNLNYFIFNAIQNDNKHKEALDELVKLIYSLEKNQFKKQDFEKIKYEFMKQNNEDLKSINDISSLTYASSYVEKILENELLLSEEYFLNKANEIFKTIKLEDINNAYKNLLKSKSKAITFNASHDINFTKNDVLNAYEQAKKDIKISTNEKQLPKNLTPKNLKPAKIVKEVYNKNFDFYEFTLQNGIKVVYKFNDYDKNLVLLNAFAKGGFSDYKNDDLINAKIAVNIIASSGFDMYNILDVQKIYYDKIVEVSPFLSMYNKGFNANSVTSDFQFMLEGVYLFANKYRFDDNIFNNTLNSLKLNIENKNNNPKQKFESQFLEFYYKNDKRYTKFTLKDIEKLNKSSILKVYKNSFSNFFNFTFVIIGDIKKEEVKKYISLYLGNLETKNESYVLKDDGIRPLKNEQSFIRNFNNENISTTTIKYTKELPYSIENSVLLMGLNQVLKTKIREIIREEKSGTYSSSVFGKYQILPYSKTDLTISFTSSPKKAQELTDEIKQIIHDIKQNEVEEKYVNNFIKQKIIALKKAYKKANFWKGQLYGHYYYGTKLKTLQEYISLYEDLNPQGIKKAANLFLDTKDILITRQNPKTNE